MCCEHLVCASCQGPVSEGRCSVCRGARTQMGHHQGGGMSASAMAAILLVLMVAVAFLTTTMH